MGHVVSTPETVGFLLIPQFSMIAFTAALEPLRLANHISGQQLYRWELISPEGGIGEASCGQMARHVILAWCVFSGMIYSDVAHRY